MKLKFRSEICSSTVFFLLTSIVIFIYFRYVSDQAYNGYKSYCQHKLLCWDMNGSAVARSHPPSLLEWKAAKMRANMAAECHFPDGMLKFFLSHPGTN